MREAMSKIVKIVVLVLVIAVVAAIAVPFLVPMDKVKGVVLTKLKASTGRDVSLGNISLSVLPNISLDAEDVKVGNPAWAGGGDMAEIKTLKLGVELIPLLHGNVHIKNFTLVDPVIALIKNGDKANWQFNTANASPAAKKDAEQTDSEDKAIALPDQVSIKNGKLSYQDHGAKTAQNIDDVNLDFTSPFSGKNVKLKTSATVNGQKADITLTLSDPEAITSGSPTDVDLKLAYGAINLSWKGTLAMKGAVPTLTGALIIPKIDTQALSKSEGGEGKQSGAPAHAEGAAHWSDAPINLAALHSANADLDVTIEELVLPKTTLKDILLKLHLNNGALNLATNDIKAYDGTIKASIAANSANDISLSVALSGVKAEPLLHDFAAYDKLSGTLESQIAVTASGGSERAMVSHVNGKGNFALKNGELKGVNLLELAHNITNPSAISGGVTKFSQCDGTYTIKNGLLENKDLTLLVDPVHIAGDGTVDLPRWTVDYLLSPKLAVGSGKDAAGISVPIRAQGPLDNPSYRPDLNAALKQNLANPAAIKDTVKGLGEQLKNGGGLQNLLR
jgi:AsmA protein